MPNPIIDSNKDTTTYDPQERSFIKRPEPKVCPSCGQIMPSDVKPMTVAMNAYVSGVEGANHIIVSHDDDIIEIKGTKMYRVTGKDHNGRMVSKFAPAPTVAAPITPPKAPIVPPNK